ncbi:MAG: acetyl-CoA carboxylase biotin carboxyl carrier protein subunit [Armatimonadetes bacterium]|nr:acetyl-CoA carboxylase biotin carboxyl carrier protein subunit [Armatimonadota bacterium]
MGTRMKYLTPEGLAELPAFANLRTDVDAEGVSVCDTVTGDVTRFAYAFSGTTLWLGANGRTYKFGWPEEGLEAGENAARAPMTGRVVAIPVAVGDTVSRGDTLAVLEAMKMEYRLEAQADGTVVEIGASVGDLVDLGHLLVRLS